MNRGACPAIVHSVAKNWTLLKQLSMHEYNVLKIRSWYSMDQYSIPLCGQIICHYGKGNGNPLQYSCLENPMDRGARQAVVHGVAKSWTQLSNFTSLHFTLMCHCMDTPLCLAIHQLMFVVSLAMMNSYEQICTSFV